MQEAKDKQDKVKETMAVLDWQKNTREVQRQKEADNLYEEQNMLKQRWAEEE